MKMTKENRHDGGLIEFFLGWGRGYYFTEQNGFATALPKYSYSCILYINMKLIFYECIISELPISIDF